MSTVFRKGPYRFYFYSHEPNESPHVHIDRERYSAKFWLTPIQLARNIGYTAHELRVIEKMIMENRSKLIEAWYGYFSSER